MAADRRSQRHRAARLRDRARPDPDHSGDHRSHRGADLYFVQSGDTITGIAQQFGVDPTDLADFNNIADWNSIRVGDILYIPGPDWQTPLPLPSFLAAPSHN